MVFTQAAVVETSGVHQAAVATAEETAEVTAAVTLSTRLSWAPAPARKHLSLTANHSSPAVG